MMFDALPDITADSADWKSELTYGDVVLYRFPVLENDGSAKPKVRPCLVLDVEHIGDERLALIAYGTTSNYKQSRGYSIQVGVDDCPAAGLDQSTKFTGARRVLVSLDHPNFCIVPDKLSPVIGRLGGAARERMNAVRARIHAEHDIALERRRNRRRRSARRPRVRDVDFAVEVRSSRRRPNAEVKR